MSRQGNASPNVKRGTPPIDSPTLMSLHKIQDFRGEHPERDAFNIASDMVFEIMRETAE